MTSAQQVSICRAKQARVPLWQTDCPQTITLQKNPLAVQPLHLLTGLETWQQARDLPP